jgi:hypothetical protein
MGAYLPQRFDDVGERNTGPVHLYFQLSLHVPRAKAAVQDRTDAAREHIAMCASPRFQSQQQHCTRRTISSSQLSGELLSRRSKTCCAKRLTSDRTSANLKCCVRHRPRESRTSRCPRSNTCRVPVGALLTRQELRSERACSQWDAWKPLGERTGVQAQTGTRAALEPHAIHIYDHSTVPSSGNIPWPSI